MSAFPSTAGLPQRYGHVSFVPIGDIAAVRRIVLKLIVKCLGDFWLNIAVRAVCDTKRGEDFHEANDRHRVTCVPNQFWFPVRGLWLNSASSSVMVFSNANPKQSDKQLSEPLDDSYGVVLRHNAILCRTETGLRQALVLREAAQTVGNRLPQLGCHVWY